jgi:hypothetical protein
MKRLAILLVIAAATPALAQELPPASQAYQAIAHQAMEREAAALTEIVTLRAKVADLTKQLEVARTPKEPQPSK